MTVEKAKEHVEYCIGEIFADDSQSVRYSRKYRADFSAAIESLIHAIVDEKTKPVDPLQYWPDLNLREFEAGLKLPEDFSDNRHWFPPGDRRRYVTAGWDKWRAYKQKSAG